MNLIHSDGSMSAWLTQGLPFWLESHSHPDFTGYLYATQVEGSMCDLICQISSSDLVGGAILWAFRAAIMALLSLTHMS